MSKPMSIFIATQDYHKFINILLAQIKKHYFSTVGVKLRPQYLRVREIRHKRQGTELKILPAKHVCTYVIEICIYATNSCRKG